MHADKTPKNEYQAVASQLSDTQHGASIHTFEDNRAETLAQRKLQAMANSFTLQKVQHQPVIQQALDPSKLIGKAKMDYAKLVPVMKSLYPEQLAEFLDVVDDVPALGARIGEFLEQKRQEKEEEERARKEASAAKHAAAIKMVQEEAAERRQKEEKRIADETAEKAAVELAAAEAAAAEAAAKAAIALAAALEAAEEAAEKAELTALLKPGVHKVLTIDHIEGYIRHGFSVLHGQEYSNKKVNNKNGEKVDDYGIFININTIPSSGQSMTTHFHVHDGTPYGGEWVAHFKNGMAAAALAGWPVAKADALNLFKTLGYVIP
ncbi:MAG: hypothetical protein M3R17_15420 [Bacteroidota bacterium]|nr:hypothetical protein [Bacteroidota bacterium]